MRLDDFAAPVSEQIAAAAALGDDATRRIAETLAAAAAPAVRLALLSALSAAADEITAALLDLPGSPGVTVLLDGPDVAIEVRSEPGTQQATAPPRVDDGEATARISLRLPEALKTDVEEAAAGDGVSVNTWLVRAAAAALGSPRRADDRSTRRSSSGHHVTGWVTG